MGPKTKYLVQIFRCGARLNIVMSKSASCRKGNLYRETICEHHNRVPMLLSVTFDEIATLVWNFYWAHKFVARWIIYSCVYFYLCPFRVWPFRFVAVPVCGRFGLWPFRSVAVPVCGRSGLWPFRFLAVSVCGRYGLWPFQFVAISVCGRLGFGRFGLWPLWPESI